MSQDEIRNILKKYLEEKGVKNKFIAKNIGVSDQTISMFLREKRELSHRKLQLIYDYVMENS